MLGWGRLDAVDDLVAVHRDEGRSLGQSQTLELRVASGAAAVVAQPMFADEYKVRRSPGTRAGAKGGDREPCGESRRKRITMRTEEVQLRAMTFQVADAMKSPSSAGRITSKGHRVVLDDEGPCILHKRTGRKIRMHKKGNVFTMKMNIMAPEEKVSDARVLGELGELGSLGGRTRGVIVHLRNLTSRWPNAAGTGGLDDADHANAGASSNGQTIAGSRRPGGKEFGELCPGDEVEEGGAEDQEGLRAGGEKAGHDEEDSEEARQVRPARDPGAPTEAECERQMLTHMPYRAWCHWCATGRGRRTQH